MIKKNKNFIFILFILAILIVGCRPPTSTQGEGSSYRTGTEGLVMNFIPGAPPSKMFADEDEVDIPISIEIRNKGAYPTSKDSGWESNSVIFIGGYDKNIIDQWELGDSGNGPSVSLSEKTDVLEGKSINNPEGGYDLLEFTGTVSLRDIEVDKYTPNFLITACYDYKTKASPNVCIDPRPFSTVNERKVCNIHDVSLTNQGAPVAVTKVESKALSNSIQFKIHFKNVGKGEVIAIDELEKCSSAGEKLEKRHMDFVKIEEVEIGGNSIKSDCGQLLSVNNQPDYARLINNQGFIVCNLKDYKEDIDSAYTTPLYVELSYGYRTAISKSVEIVKVPESG